jgi:hypothetical protein
MLSGTINFTDLRRSFSWSFSSYPSLVRDTFTYSCFMFKFTIVPFIFGLLMLFNGMPFVAPNCYFTQIYNSLYLSVYFYYYLYESFPFMLDFYTLSVIIVELLVYWIALIEYSCFSQVLLILFITCSLHSGEICYSFIFFTLLFILISFNLFSFYFCIPYQELFY